MDDRDYVIEPLCEVRQIEDYCQPTEPGFPQCFDIVVDFTLMGFVSETDDDDEPTSSSSSASPASCAYCCGTRIFRFDVDLLLHSGIDEAEWAICNMLADVGVAGIPEHAFMEDKILHFAAEMAGHKRNQGLLILPMGVSVKCLASRDILEPAPTPSASPNDGEEDGMMSEDEFTSMDDRYDDIMAELTASPVPHESFEGKLKNLMILEGETLTCCTICLEDIGMGSRATRMPCSHIFHEDCIKEWLVSKRSCPVCRFEI